MTLPDLTTGPETLTVAEAASRARLSPERIREMLIEGRIEHFKTGDGPRARYRIPAAALVAAMKRNFARFHAPQSASEVDDKIEQLFAADRKDRKVKRNGRR